MAEALAPSVLKKVVRELTDLTDKAIEGIRVTINEQNLADVNAEIDGPVGTPYEGGCFKCRLVLGSDYPQCPPKGFFLTKIFHPNVSAAGDICVNVLKRDWTPDTGIKHVLLVIRCLLVDPNPDSALNEEAGRLLQDDYDEYAARARLLTSIHACSHKRMGPLTASGGNASTQQHQGGQGPGSGLDNLKQQSSTGQGPGGSPSKKAKGEVGAPATRLPATAASKVKKSLKRL